MTALSNDKNVKQFGTGGEPVSLPLPVAASTTIYKGSLICSQDADGYATVGATATTLVAVGVAKEAVDNSSGSDGDKTVEVERGMFRFENSAAGDAIAITERYDVCFIVDDQTVAKTNGGSTRSRAGIIMDVDSYGVWVLVGTSIILDYSTLETAVNGLVAHSVSTDHTIPLSLYDFREVDANGDVANIAGNGGILASDSTPALEGDAAESQIITWVASNNDLVAVQVGLPDELDATENVVVELIVSSGTTDDATFTVESGWDGNALVSDTATETAKSATPHKITATILAADIAATPEYLTLILTPAAHTTDAVNIHGVRIKYTGKLLT